jgi:hypothetical protein
MRGLWAYRVITQKKVVPRRLHALNLLHHRAHKPPAVGPSERACLYLLANELDFDELPPAIIDQRAPPRSEFPARISDSTQSTRT